MNWYVSVLGSYDASYVGPFYNKETAERWAHKEAARKPQFDFWACSETDMRENIAEFGEVPVYKAGE